MRTIRAHKIKLNPTPDQEESLLKAAGTARFAYNWAVAQWRSANGKKPGAAELRKRFEIEKPAWVPDDARGTTEGAFHDFGKALSRYYAGQAGEPQFRKRSQGTFRFKLNKNRFEVVGHWFAVPQLGSINLAEPLRFSGKVLGATITQDADGWYVSIPVQLSTHDVHASNKRPRGMMLNDRALFETLRPLRTALGRLASLQQLFANKQMGSKKRAKLNWKMAHLYQRIRHISNDLSHKLTAWLPDRNSLAAADDPSDVTKNQSPASIVSDATLGQLIDLVEKTGIGVNDALGKLVRYFFPPKTCAQCGLKRADPLIVDAASSNPVFVCPRCGFALGHEPDAAVPAATRQLAERLRVAELNAPSASGYDGRESPPQTGYTFDGQLQER